MEVDQPVQHNDPDWPTLRAQLAKRFDAFWNNTTSVMYLGAIVILSGSAGVWLPRVLRFAFHQDGGLANGPPVPDAPSVVFARDLAIYAIAVLADACCELFLFDRKADNQMKSCALAAIPIGIVWLLSWRMTSAWSLAVSFGVCLATWTLWIVANGHSDRFLNTPPAATSSLGGGENTLIPGTLGSLKS
jgi:hypothetical protein